MNRLFQIAQQRRRVLIQNAVFVGAIADLNVTAYDDTTITLDWTTPSADNPIDYFEVWVDNVFYENTNDDTEGWVVTGLTAGTSYNIKLKTVDTLGNKSAFSNEVTFSTWMALSYTSTTSLNLAMQTQSGQNWEIDWGDGVWISYSSSTTLMTKTFGVATAGTAKIRSAVGNPISDINYIRTTVGTWSFDATALLGLTSLTALRLIGNGFTGDMSDVKLLTSLTDLYLNSNGFTGDMSDVKLLTSLTVLYLIGNGFTGDMSDVKLLTSLTILYLNSNGFTGDMSDVKLLTSLTILYLSSNGFTGDMSDVKLLTSLTVLYLIGNGFTGDMSDVKLLTSLTILYLNSNGFTGDMSDVKLLTSLTILRLIGNGFTLSYSTFVANFSILLFRLKTGELSNPADIDQLFIDLDASTTAGNGSIDVRSSGAAAPTATSLAARNSLVAKGRTILTN